MALQSPGCLNRPAASIARLPQSPGCLNRPAASIARVTNLTNFGFLNFFFRSHTARGNGRCRKSAISTAREFNSSLSVALATRQPSWRSLKALFKALNSANVAGFERLASYAQTLLNEGSFSIFSQRVSPRCAIAIKLAIRLSLLPSRNVNTLTQTPMTPARIPTFSIIFDQSGKERGTPLF